jgi:hypothetical protein
MLVRRGDDGALAIGQLSHAWLSGQLARRWGNALFGEVAPREEIVLGAQQHDIGWALFDLHPRFNPETGLPRTFLEITVPEHLAIWRGAPDQLMTQSMYAALLVSLHGSALSRLRARSMPEQAPLLEAHIDEERSRQAMLRESLGLSAAVAERARLQLRAWDGISLALCNGADSFIAREVPTAEGQTDIELHIVGESAVTLDPWPFDTSRLSVCCEARHLAARYPDEAEMRRAFDLAERAMLTFTLVRP